MMNPVLKTLSKTVQYNCNISDAHHAGHYTLCIYLLKMREFYRWECDKGFAAQLGKENLGAWMAEREDLWTSLEGNDFAPLTIDDKEFNPFDSGKINQQLASHNMVYSAGYGSKFRPHFFLGELENVHREGDYTIYISNKEYARDLTAPPAMAQGQTIFIRRESLRRMLWEKYEEWLWNKPDNAMKRAIQFYPFDTDINLALEKMTENELHMAVLHEMGEIRSSSLLGSQWLEILSELPRSKGEILFRSVKDHLADNLSTLPALMKKFKPESLHFYMANLSSMRKVIAPQLLQRYEQWLVDQSLTPLEEYIAMAGEHWLKLAGDMMQLRETTADNTRYIKELSQLVENNYC